MNDWSTKVDRKNETFMIETEDEIKKVETKYTEEGHLIIELFNKKPEKKVDEILFIRKIGLRNSDSENKVETFPKQNHYIEK
jgi:hypothetical protein